MNQPVLRLAKALLIFSFLVFANTSLAQQPNNPSSVAGADVSYEALLQLVVGSNDAATRDELPRNLAAIARQLKDNFAFTSFRVSNTFLGRSAATGRIEYKSVADRIGSPDAAQRPTFLDWSLGLRPGEATAPNSQVVQNFRFGARVPIVTAQVRNPEGQTSNVVNYESIGLSTERLVVPLGKPSIVGTISLPGSSGTVFLVLTIRPAGE